MVTDWYARRLDRRLRARRPRPRDARARPRLRAGARRGRRGRRASTRRVVDAQVRRLLARLRPDRRARRPPSTASAVDRPRGPRARARGRGRAMVLLSNDGVLPLDPSLARAARRDRARTPTARRSWAAGRLSARRTTASPPRRAPRARSAPASTIALRAGLRHRPRGPPLGVRARRPDRFDVELFAERRPHGEVVARPARARQLHLVLRATARRSPPTAFSLRAPRRG